MGGQSDFAAVIAVALGILAGNTVEIPSARVGMRFAASRLLRIGVLLVALRVALDDLAAIGLPGLVVVMMVVTGHVLRHPMDWASNGDLTRPLPIDRDRLFDPRLSGGVGLGSLRKLGGKPLALGMGAWVLVAGMSYLGVLITR